MKENGMIKHHRLLPIISISFLAINSVQEAYSAQPLQERIFIFFQDNFQKIYKASPQFIKTGFSKIQNNPRKSIAALALLALAIPTVVKRNKILGLMKRSKKVTTKDQKPEEKEEEKGKDDQSPEKPTETPAGGPITPEDMSITPPYVPVPPAGEGPPAAPPVVKTLLTEEELKTTLLAEAKEIVETANRLTFPTLKITNPTPGEAKEYQTAKENFNAIKQKIGTAFNKIKKQKKLEKIKKFIHELKELLNQLNYIIQKKETKKYAVQPKPKPKK